MKLKRSKLSGILFTLYTLTVTVWVNRFAGADLDGAIYFITIFFVSLFAYSLNYLIVEHIKTWMVFIAYTTFYLLSTTFLVVFFHPRAPMKGLLDIFL